MVQTPMFTADPEQAKKWGYDPTVAVTAEIVADAMIDLVVNEHPGGTCIEVSRSGTRPLGVWNIEAPTSVGASVPQDVVDQNFAHLTAIMRKEREASKPETFNIAP